MTAGPSVWILAASDVGSEQTWCTTVSQSFKWVSWYVARRLNKAAIDTQAEYRRTSVGAQTSESVTDGPRVITAGAAA